MHSMLQLLSVMVAGGALHLAEVSSMLTAVLLCNRGWDEQGEKWGWTRDPPVSVHKSGAADPEKAKRRQVGHVMNSKRLASAAVHSTICPVLHQVLGSSHMLWLLIITRMAVPLQVGLHIVCYTGVV